MISDFVEGDYVRFKHHTSPAYPVFRLRPTLSFDDDGTPVLSGLERVVAASFSPYPLGKVLDFDELNAAQFVKCPMPLVPAPARSTRADRSGSRRRTP